MLFALRRPASQLTPADWTTEIALVVLATVWFSPVVWSYHPTSAVPALAIVMTSPDEKRKRIASAVWVRRHGAVCREPGKGRRAT